MAPIDPNTPEDNAFGMPANDKENSPAPTDTSKNGNNTSSPGAWSFPGGNARGVQETSSLRAPLPGGKPLRFSSWSSNQQHHVGSRSPAPRSYDDLVRDNVSMLTTLPLTPRGDLTRRRALNNLAGRPTNSFSNLALPLPPPPHYMIPQPQPQPQPQLPAFLDPQYSALPPPPPPLPQNSGTPILTSVHVPGPDQTLFFPGFDGLPYMTRNQGLEKELQEKQDKRDCFLKVGVPEDVIKELRELIEVIKDQLFAARMTELSQESHQ